MTSKNITGAIYYTYRILQIIQGGKVLQFFVDQSVPRNVFSEIACAIGFRHARLRSNRKSSSANESLVLQPQNFSTLNNQQYTAGTYIG